MSDLPISFIALTTIFTYILTDIFNAQTAINDDESSKYLLRTYIRPGIGLNISHTSHTIFFYPCPNPMRLVLGYQSPHLQTRKLRHRELSVSQDEKVLEMNGDGHYKRT